MTELSQAEADRRDFLKAAGKFAVVVPPAMTVLMSTAWAGHEGIFHSNEGGGQEKQGNPPDGNNNCNNNENNEPPDCPP